MRRRLLVLAILPLLAVAIVACGVPGDDGFRPLDNADIAELRASTTTTTTTTTMPTTTTVPATTTSAVELSTTVAETTTTLPTELVDFYFVTSGDQLDRLAYPLAVDPSADQVLNVLAGGLVPFGTLGATMRTAIPSGAMFSLTSTSEGTATIDLPSSSLTSNPADLKLEFAQIVLTLLNQLPGVGRLTFTVDGVPAAIENGAGAQIPAGGTVSIDDYVDLVVQR